MDRELVVIEQKAELDRPPMYQVVLLNDDFTPMDFVVELLVKIFGHNEATAADIMMAVHDNGEAVAETTSYDIAESRVAHVNMIAQNNEFPLKVIMRPE